MDHYAGTPHERISTRISSNWSPFTPGEYYQKGRPCRRRSSHKPPKPVPGPYLSLAKEHNKVRKMGFLYQRIPEALIWKKRFFVVTETSLLSFGKPIDPASAEFDPEDETSKNLKGYTSLSLTKTELVKATEEMGGSGEDLIKLTTGDATEYFHLCTTKPKGPKPKQKKKVEEEAETTKAADDDVSPADDVVDDMGTKEPSEAVVAAAEDVVLEEANGDVAEVVEPTASPQLEAVSAATEGAGTGDALLEWSAAIKAAVEYANEFELSDQMVPDEGLLEWYDTKWQKALEQSIDIAASPVTLFKHFRTSAGKKKERVFFLDVPEWSFPKTEMWTALRQLR